MKELHPMFNDIPETFIEVSTLVDHVTYRSIQLNLPLTGFTSNAVIDWLLEFSMNYQVPTLLVTEESISELGCRTICSTIQDMQLQAVIHSDITILFHGYPAANEILRSALPDREPERAFEPPGIDRYHFPNGARGISTTYLADLIGEVEVSNEELEMLCMYGEEADSNTLGVTEFYGYYPAAYLGDGDEMQRHIWVSPALAVLLVSRSGPAPQAKLLNDLNFKNPF